MLDRLVGGSVLAEPDRVVGPDVDDGQAGQRREPDRSAHVIAECQEGGDVRVEAPVVGKPVRDPAHRMLADAEPEVATGRLGAEVVGALDVGQVRFGQVRRATEQLRHALRQRLDRVLARVPRGDFGAGVIGLEVGVPAIGEVTGQPPPELGRECRMCRGVCLEPGLPGGNERRRPPGSPRGSARPPRPARRTSDPDPSRTPPS